MRKIPIRKKRPVLRRGELAGAEKRQIRDAAYERAHGRCELVPNCRWLPKDGDLFTRAHLVHLRAKRVHGWGMENLAIGCYTHHMASHNGHLTLPSTYEELIANKPVATAQLRIQALEGAREKVHQ